MEKTIFEELKSEFIKCNFTQDEIKELAFAGFVALKDYKNACVEEAE